MSTDTLRKPLTTDTQIKGCKPDTTTYDRAIAGSRGLVLRIYPSGAKHWLYRARNRDTGKLEKITLGEYRSGQKVHEDDKRLSLEEAKAVVEGYRSLKRSHGSAKTVIRERQAQERAERLARAELEARDTFTVAAMIDDYLKVVSDEGQRAAKRGRGFIKSHREVRRALEKYILDRDPNVHQKKNPNAGVGSDLGLMVANKVEAKDVIAQLNIATAGKPVQRNRVISYLKAVYNFTIRREANEGTRRVASNPCQYIDKAEEEPSDRALSKTEIRRFLENLPKTEMPLNVQRLLRVMLLTGLRPGCAAKIERQHIDVDRNALALPASIMKSGRPFIVPISPQLQSVIDESESTGYLFPNRRGHEYESNDIAKELRNALPKLEVFKFTPKSLRATFATEISHVHDDPEKKVPKHIKERLLDHADATVSARHYDKYDYFAEKRFWLNEWAVYIASLTAGPAKSAQLTPRKRGVHS